MPKPKIKKIPKKITDTSSKYWRTKCWTLWSKIVRQDADYKCAICQSTNGLQAHHIVPKEKFPQISHLITNGICLCNVCHKFGAYSAHRHPVWFVEKLKAISPIKYEAALSNLNLKPQKWSETNFKEMYEYLLVANDAL